MIFSDLCLAEIKSLASTGLINNDNNKINSRPEGEIMAKYLLSFETMKSFMHVRTFIHNNVHTATINKNIKDIRIFFKLLIENLI